jgi:hypothetical protein
MRAAITARDGPFRDYSQADADGSRDAERQDPLPSVDPWGNRIEVERPNPNHIIRI